MSMESKHQPLILVTCSDMSIGQARAADALRGMLDPEAGIDTNATVADLSGVSLFGANPMVVSAQYKDEVEELSRFDFGSYDDGLAIVSSRPGTASDMRALIKAVKSAGGLVVGRNDSMAAAIDELPVKPDLKRFIHDYTADSYDKARGIVFSLASMSREECASLGMDDIIARMPQTPGERLPWGSGFGRNHVKGLDELLLERDSGPAMDLMDRVLDGGCAPNMIIAWLAKTWKTSMEITMMAQAGENWSTIAAVERLPDPKYRRKGEKDPAMGRSGYPTYRRIQSCAQLPIPWMMRSMKAIYQADAALKGASMESISDRNIMVRMVAAICA